MSQTLPRRAAALVVTALALLLPLAGGAAPAAARSVARSASTSVGAAVVAAPSQATTGQHRRARAPGGHAGPSRAARHERRASALPPAAHRTGHLPHTPVRPTRCAAGNIGQPGTCSAVLHRPGLRAAGRFLPVGAGRSPPPPAVADVPVVPRARPA
ncbi:MAG: hypothetical protein QOI54_418 [Actinomycetota bacterium]|nr:hypothetical protein [Actinomycetota bacterium]